MNLLFGLFPSPPPLKARSRVYELKARLDWGEPALTIIDVRDRYEFNQCHIMGAVHLPTHQLVDRALVSLELIRDLYIYSDTDEDTAVAAAKLREVGYLNVSELQGGLPVWKAYDYPIERGVLSLV
ncbi:MAG: rhodanese-like domain-containing protein [Cyanobacteria bacterium RU_5_0]|nr:rhodanese-like domain-containing protein [Cyanobacteria bacterium RU_5_0]